MANSSPAWAQSAKRVLLLNSYSYALPWTASVTRGVEESFALRGSFIKLSVEFMDTKNYFNPEYLSMLAAQYRMKYAGVHFDAIITSDDNAANFALEHRKEIFDDSPIIFCGVNNDDFPKHEGFSNITGLLESIDIMGTIKAALKLQPGVKRIFMITDETTTGTNNRILAEKVMPQFNDQVEFTWLEGMSMEELKKTLATLPDDSAILLITFNRDRLGQWFTFSECISNLREVARCPIYSMWDFYLGEGIVGGMLTSGQYQGAIAAGMALRILDGENPDDIPVITQKSNRYMFDYAVIKKFGLDPNLLPEDSVLINVPESVYEKYTREIWVLLGLLFFMSVVILFLGANVRARRQAENNLEDLNRYQETLIDQRTDELTQRSKELEIANYELTKVDELKTAVLNTVSHDLRTPLTSVLGFCKIIDRDFNKFFYPLSKNDDELQERGERILTNFSIIEDEGKRLTRLINDFLDLSKIESGSIAWNDVSVNPSELIRQAAPVLEGYFSESGVKLELDIAEGLPYITADPDRILQVLNNLVGNAAKFTHQGHVSLRATTTEGGWLKVIVSDTGIGIPVDEIDQIFDKFYQVAQDVTAPEISRGSGMGLAISKRIIEHYGGTITARSENRKGSSFVFTIPSAG